MKRAALLFLSCSVVWGQPQKDRHVVLITLDGFPAYALQDPALSVPNLRRLAREGAFADRMITSNPTVTWPNHTSMVTGVPPAQHSVLYIRCSDETRRAVARGHFTEGAQNPLSLHFAGRGTVATSAIRPCPCPHRQDETQAAGLSSEMGLSHKNWRLNAP